ncbi:hypothetical protein ACFV4K_15805 [Nocardia sp. NPDC059764]|uniref:hypothetical protein n=1 Tax=Nocardia sp. NPDC059764 TaxID=3346939 RepID=UPI0036476052
MTLHKDCGESCDTHRYYEDLVPKLEQAARESELRRPEATAWNIWSRPEIHDGEPRSSREFPA